MPKDDHRDLVGGPEVKSDSTKFDSAMKFLQEYTLIPINPDEIPERSSVENWRQVTGGVAKEAVNHPDHYGGKDNPYEAIKVIRAWKLGFNLGNTVKYISRAGKKDPKKLIEDLKKARWYLDDEISELEKQAIKVVVEEPPIRELRYQPPVLPNINEV